MSAPDPLACRLRPAQDADRPAIVALLGSCALPADDLPALDLGHFEVAQDGAGRLLGLAGLELAGGDALLRSLAVAPDWRGRGLAGRLVARREVAAHAAGARSIYLLTTGAADFFRRHAYADVARDHVPPAIAAHAQFRSLCPASAACLSKRLQPAFPSPQPTRNRMPNDKTLEIFDPAMCCATGVCGLDVDPTLVQVAADLKWLAEHGVTVTRFNLGQEPQAFAANAAVLKEMEAGIDRLPITLIDGRIVARGVYLTRAQLAQQLGVKAVGEGLRQIKIGSGCKAGSGCC